MGFLSLLRARWETADSLLCVGLDPDPGRFPGAMRGRADAIADFCIGVVDATADLVCAFKPQIAHFAAHGAESQLERVCAHIRDRYPDVPIILDAKRGDIGDTAEMYAREAFDRYGAHAVTVNPYLGTDSLEPYLGRDGAGVIVLCRTSNPGSGLFQSLETGGEPLYMRVARTAATDWSTRGDVGLVVGATYPAELARVRDAVGEMPLLVPGVGAQGADARAVVDNGADSRGRGLIVNSSRAILYADGGEGPEHLTAVRAAARATRDLLAGRAG